ncbi:GlcG/HbpS family heme-binding protein [Phycicoccus sonneratiae]|uniref:Heme-binding protein n=1 Tax=Phycicoccus sonneratiae TaxID=2807628 RepID=A0ABS2CPN1_9MICO|nr:heme-binding protein [Phycicoccus sonneraticus]MBM6401383.1 heme-binding protein [Phycicoccus sonneraticus]
MLVRTETTLTLAGARVALDAALARAEEVGGAFNVAVTDASGTLLAFARMDGAFAASGDIARDKAWTVTAFGGLPTGTFYDAISGEDAVREGIAHRPRVAAFGGGVPVLVDDVLVGAVGASGGSAAQDTEVAAAGAAAVEALATDVVLAVPGDEPHRVPERTAR